MRYVYILKSKKSKSRVYIGITNNIDRRLKEHSNPKSDSYTRRYAPWTLATYIAFTNVRLAEEFEMYLKSHSGRAFLRKRLIAV
jgi:predicted GIY-YIG superfamily endonuclease